MGTFVMRSMLLCCLCVRALHSDLVRDGRSEVAARAGGSNTTRVEAGNATNATRVGLAEIRSDGTAAREIRAAQRVVQAEQRVVQRVVQAEQRGGEPDAAPNVPEPGPGLLPPPGLTANPEVAYLLLIALIFTWSWIAVMWGFGYFRPSKDEPKRRSSLHYNTGDLACDEVVCNTTLGAKLDLNDSRLSTFDASQSLFTVMVGAGILAFPRVIASCGWLVGIFCIVAGGTFNAVAALTLVDSIERASRRGSVSTFKDVAHICFGTYGGMFAEASFIALLFSICAVFIVLIGENLNFLLPWSRRGWVLISGVCVSSTALVKDVSYLAKLAFIGVFASLMYVICITSGGLTAASLGGHTREFNTMPTASAGSILSKFCVCLLGFCCSNTLTSIRGTMERPEEINTAISQSHFAAAVVYIGAGCVGYYGWGNAVQGNVLESMKFDDSRDHPYLKGNMISGYLLAFAVVCNLVVSLPFNCFVLFQTLGAKFPQVRSSSGADMGLRVAVMVAITLVAMVVPYFMELLTIIASVLIVSIVLLWPSAFAMQLDRMEGKSIVSSHAVTFICGIAVGCISFVTAVGELSGAIAKDAQQLSDSITK